MKAAQSAEKTQHRASSKLGHPAQWTMIWPFDQVPHAENMLLHPGLVGLSIGSCKAELLESVVHGGSRLSVSVCRMPR
jgi:hypothetical protein